MKTVSLYSACAYILIALVVGIGVGYALTSEYRFSMYEKSAMDLGPADRTLDLRYLNAMIAHHRGAMLLAEQATVSDRVPIRDLAREILETEPILIDELTTWKKEWYGDVRPVRDPQVARLGMYDDTFDLRFLNALIAHHEEGVVMTRDVRSKSSRSEVLSNADTVEAFLTQSARTLVDWRTEWYGI